MAFYNITTETTHRILWQGFDPDIVSVVLRRMGAVHQAILDTFYDDMDYIDDINALYPLHCYVTVDDEDCEIAVFAQARSFMRKQNSLGWFVVITTPDTGAYIIDNVSPEDRRVALADLVMMPEPVRQLWETSY